MYVLNNYLLPECLPKQNVIIIAKGCRKIKSRQSDSKGVHPGQARLRKASDRRGEKTLAIILKANPRRPTILQD